jgi:ankyrin repeat protein
MTKREKTKPSRCLFVDVNKHRDFQAILRIPDESSRTRILKSSRNPKDVEDLHALKSLKDLIASGADVNMTNKRGATPLINACTWGMADYAKVLIEAGACMNHVTIWGDTALVRAAAGGHNDCVKTLLSHGTDVNEGKEYCALVEASRANRLETVRLLLAAGANVNGKAREGSTSLMVAAQGKHVDIVRELIVAKADLNALEWGRLNALSMAMYGENNSRFSRSPRITDERCVEIVRMLLKAGADVNVGRSLIVACEYGLMDIVELLLEYRADVNLVIPTGITALSTAYRRCCLEMVECLIKHGATASKDLFFERPHFVQNNKRFYEALIEAGAVVNFVKNGITPLMQACTWGKFDVAKALIDNGADVGYVSPDGRSALSQTCRYCGDNPEDVQMLLSSLCEQVSPAALRQELINIVEGTAVSEPVRHLLTERLAGLPAGGQTKSAAKK